MQNVRNPPGFDPHDLIESKAESVKHAYVCRVGSYKQVPVDMIDSQPRVGIPVILHKANNNRVRSDFISRCFAINKSLVENGILRVNK